MGVIRSAWPTMYKTGVTVAFKPWVYNFPQLWWSKLDKMANLVLLTKIHLFICSKQITNVFSFVQWNKYFHSVKDEMFYSTRLHLDIHLSPHEIFVPLHSKHSLFVHYYMLSKCNLPLHKIALLRPRASAVEELIFSTIWCLTFLSTISNDLPCFTSAWSLL